MGRWLRNRGVSFIIFYLFAMGITTVILLHRYKTNTDEYIQAHVAQFERQMDSYQSMQQKMMDNYYGLFLEGHEIAEIMEKAADADEQTQAFLRNDLKGRTEAMFASLKNFEIRLLFFHLPENIAFLRLHKPEKFGDSLTKARPSVVQAQKTRQKLVTFETGKLFDGFRSIYPIFHHKKFVGTVEIAYPFLALKNQALRQSSGAYTFLVKRSIQEGKSKAAVIAESYQDSPFGTKYFEDKESTLKKGAKGFTDKELDHLISHNRGKIQTALREEKLQGLVLPYEGKYALMVLNPVKEISGKHAAYMVEITPDHVFFANERSQLIELLISISLLLALLMWYIFRYNRSVIVLEQYKKAIDENMIISKADRSGIITYVNQRFMDISGYREDELIGKPHSIIRHPDTSPAVFKQMWRKIKKGKIWHGAIQNRSKFGESYYVNSTICPILDENGEVIEYIGLREDVTQLIEANKREEKLRIEAQRSEMAKMEFLANMSHEIRTPLNGIMGFAKLLSDAELSPENHRQAKIISEQSKTLMGVINDILDLSKIESGNLTLEKVQVNPFTEFENAFSLFAPIAKEKEIGYIIRLDEKLFENIEVDILRLKQVMTNLISNALKFTPGGGSVTIEIRVLESSPSAQRLHFSVTDTGIGIAKEKLASIFSPFTQEDSSTTRQFGGTGLGLSISSKLVKLFGGELQVDSQKGEGSCFWFDMEVDRGDPRNILAASLAGKRIGLVYSQKEGYGQIKNQLDAYGIVYDECKETIAEATEKIQIPYTLVITFEKEAAEKFSIAGKAYFQHIILIDPISQGWNSERVMVIDNYEQCPSFLYNFLLSLNTADDNKSESDDSIRPQWSDKRILVAEDYDVNRILIEALLQLHGITPDFAENGQQACEMVEKNAYDLILMDINMPVMDGVEATRILRQNHVDLPIIALTANALKGDRERFIAEGMSGYLTKPILPDELSKILKQYFGEEISADDNNSNTGDGDGNFYHDAKESLRLSDAVLDRLFSVFDSSFPERIKVLEEAITAVDFKEIELQAHTINGSAGNLQLKKISSVAAQIEIKARDGEMDGINSLVEELKSFYAEFQKRRQP